MVATRFSAARARSDHRPGSGRGRPFVTGIVAMTALVAAACSGSDAADEAPGADAPQAVDSACVPTKSADSVEQAPPAPLEVSASAEIGNGAPIDISATSDSLWVLSPGAATGSLTQLDPATAEFKNVLFVVYN